MSKVTNINRQAQQPAPGPFLSRADAAARCALSVRTLERLFVEGGGPPAAVLGRRVVYSLPLLDAWVGARIVPNTAAATMMRQAEAGQ